MKSQIEFNWIFIIIAGAIILTFFVTFAFKYKSVQEEKLSVDLLINLDKALYNLQASPYATFDIIDIPKDLQITCNDLKIGDRSYSNNNLIFSPENLKDKIYIYFKQFNFPFKVDNFYYIISPGNNFYLVYNQNDQKAKEFTEDLINNLPEKFKNNIKISTIRKPNAKNIFINTNAQPNDVKITINDKITINYNNINYEDVNQELVYGAIFSDDFDCVYKKIKPRFENVINSYEKKLVLLQNSNCNYAILNQYLQKLKNFHYSDTKIIEILNQDLASLNCPILY